jgi:hypothetical protein
MKKTLALAVAFVLGLAFSANAQVETKSTTKVQGAKTTETDTVKVKTPEGKEIKAKEVKTTNVGEPGTTETTSEIKGKNAKAKRTVVEKEGKVEGTTKVDMKKGSIKDLEIDWTYETAKIGNTDNYIIKYTVTKNSNDKLAKELKLTPDQAKAISPGEHTITSTSPYTAGDVQQNFRAVILKHVKDMAAKK